MSDLPRSIIDDIVICPTTGGQWIAEPWPTSAYPAHLKTRAATPERALFWLVEQLEKEDRLTLANEVTYTVIPF